MTDKIEKMISTVEKEALTSSLSLMLETFFSEITLNDMIMETNVQSEKLQLNLNQYAMKKNQNSVINQSPNEQPHFFIHRSVLLSSFTESLIMREKKKTESNIFQLEVEIEKKKEKFEVYLDTSSTWIKVEGELLNKLWNKMLEMKISLAVKKVISEIMKDDFLYHILINNLSYNQITVDLRK